MSSKIDKKIFNKHKKTHKSYNLWVFQNRFLGDYDFLLRLAKAPKRLLKLATRPSLVDLRWAPV